jgi:transcriptional regulator with XRE-family HTH domain
MRNEATANGGRPARPVVTFEGVKYEMDRHALRVALVRRQVAGEFHTKEELADSVGCSRSTISRYLSGRIVSLAVRVLEKLHLRFEEVYRQCEEPAAASQER